MSEISTGRSVLQVVDARARTIDTTDELEQTSIDYYATVRSLYRQYRAAEISDHAAAEDIDIPDFDTPGPAPEEPSLDEGVDIPTYDPNAPTEQSAPGPAPAREAGETLSAEIPEGYEFKGILYVPTDEIPEEFQGQVAALPHGPLPGEADAATALAAAAVPSRWWPRRRGRTGRERPNPRRYCRPARPSRTGTALRRTACSPVRHRRSARDVGWVRRGANPTQEGSIPCDRSFASYLPANPHLKSRGRPP